MQNFFGACLLYTYTRKAASGLATCMHAVQSRMHTKNYMCIYLHSCTHIHTHTVTVDLVCIHSSIHYTNNMAEWMTNCILSRSDYLMYLATRRACMSLQSPGNQGCTTCRERYLVYTPKDLL